MGLGPPPVRQGTGHNEAEHRGRAGQGQDKQEVPMLRGLERSLEVPQSFEGDPGEVVVAGLAGRAHRAVVLRHRARLPIADDLGACVQALRRAVGVVRGFIQRVHVRQRAMAEHAKRTMRGSAVAMGGGGRGAVHCVQPKRATALRRVKGLAHSAQHWSMCQGTRKHRTKHWRSQCADCDIFRAYPQCPSRQSPPPPPPVAEHH